MVLQKKKLKNGMVFHMTTSKKLLKLHNDIIKVIHAVNDSPSIDLKVLSRRMDLLKQLSNALPVISELINQVNTEEQIDLDNFKVGMTSSDD